MDKQIVVGGPGWRLVVGADFEEIVLGRPLLVARKEVRGTVYLALDNRRTKCVSSSYLFSETAIRDIGAMNGPHERPPKGRAMSRRAPFTNTPGAHELPAVGTQQEPSVDGGVFRSEVASKSGELRKTLYDFTGCAFVARVGDE